MKKYIIIIILIILVISSWSLFFSLKRKERIIDEEFEQELASFKTNDEYREYNIDSLKSINVPNSVTSISEDVWQRKTIFWQANLKFSKRKKCRINNPIKFMGSAKNNYRRPRLCTRRIKKELNQNQKKIGSVLLILQFL